MKLQLGSGKGAGVVVAAGKVPGQGKSTLVGEDTQLEVTGKFLLAGAGGDQTKVAELEGEPLLHHGLQAPAPISGQQRGEWGHPALHPEQEQLPAPHVWPSG